MASLLLVIFFIQLAIHIINSVGAAAVSELAWLLYAKLPTPTSRLAQKSSQQWRELLHLKREMNSISAQDDFARWAKLRRQHDKASEEYNKTSASLSSSKTQFTTAAGGARWLGTNGLRLTLQFWFSKKPMFWIPRGWLPGLVERVLAFPRAPTGSVSVQIWGMACNSVIAMVAEVVIALWTLTRPVDERRKEEPQAMSQDAGEKKGQ